MYRSIDDFFLPVPLPVLNHTGIGAFVTTTRRLRANARRRVSRGPSRTILDERQISLDFTAPAPVPVVVQPEPSLVTKPTRKRRAKRSGSIRIELEIFDLTSDQVLARYDEDLAGQVYASVIRQAWIDAKWCDSRGEDRPMTGRHDADNNRLERRAERLDAIDFFAGVVDPSPDCVDPGLGEAEELATLEYLCREVLEWDARIVRAEALRRLCSVSPLHTILLRDALANAPATGTNHHEEPNRTASDA